MMLMTSMIDHLPTLVVSRPATCQDDEMTKRPCTHPAKYRVECTGWTKHLCGLHARTYVSRFLVGGRMAEWIVSVHRLVVPVQVLRCDHRTRPGMVCPHLAKYRVTGNHHPRWGTKVSASGETPCGIHVRPYLMDNGDSVWKPWIVTRLADSGTPEGGAVDTSHVGDPGSDRPAPPSGFSDPPRELTPDPTRGGPGRGSTNPVREGPR